MLLWSGPTLEHQHHTGLAGMRDAEGTGRDGRGSCGCQSKILLQAVPWEAGCLCPALKTWDSSLALTAMLIPSSDSCTWSLGRLEVLNPADSLVDMAIAGMGTHYTPAPGQVVSVCIYCGMR